MEGLIFFVIFVILSLLRSLTERTSPAQPGRPVKRLGTPGRDLPDLWETVLRPPAGKVHGQREVLPGKSPVPLSGANVMETVVETASVRPAPADIPAEEEGEAFFQLDRDTILLGLVFSELLNEPRARHRRFSRGPR